MNYEKCIFKKKSGETINVYEKEIDDIDIFMIEHMIKTYDRDMYRKKINKVLKILCLGSTSCTNFIGKIFIFIA